MPRLPASLPRLVFAAVLTATAIATPHRTVGAKIANAIQLRRNAGKLASTEVTCCFTGSAGQSFGAFAVHDMHLLLEGEANDYVGKGMSGGEIAIRPSAEAPFATGEPFS